MTSKQTNKQNKKNNNKVDKFFNAIDKCHIFFEKADNKKC